MKKLLPLLTLVGSLQAMNRPITTNNQPTAGAPATHTAVTGAQEIDAAAPTTPQFTFKRGIPSLRYKAAVSSTPEAIENGYQSDFPIYDQIKEAEKAGDNNKIKELMDRTKRFPWPLLERTQGIPQIDKTKLQYQAGIESFYYEKIENALEKDDPNLLKIAMEKRKIDPRTSNPLLAPKTKTPLLEAISLEVFIKIANLAVRYNAKESLNFLLSSAETISLSTLNDLLTFADSRKTSAEIIQLIINRGARGEFFDKWNQFPLHKAVVENRALEVAKLIDDKIEVNLIAHGMTPLLLACRYGTDETSYTITKLLIENGANINLQDSKGVTALMYASLKGHIGVVQLLIAKNPEVNLRDSQGLSALMYASEKGYTSIAKLLIAKNAKVNAQDNYNASPLTLACEKGHTAVAQLLIESGAKINKESLISAVDSRNISLIKLLIENDVERNNNDERPLMLASIRGDTAIVQLLIDNGANVNAQDTNDMTPLMYASNYGQTAVAEILITEGADVNAQTTTGMTPLMYASSSGQTDVVQLFIKKNIGIHIKDRYGKNALMYASKNGHTAVVQLLIDNDADIGTRTDDGQTALYIARKNNHPDIVEILNKAIKTTETQTKDESKK